MTRRALNFSRSWRDRVMVWYIRAPTASFSTYGKIEQHNNACSTASKWLDQGFINPLVSSKFPIVYQVTLHLYQDKYHFPQQWGVYVWFLLHYSWVIGKSHEMLFLPSENHPSFFLSDLQFTTNWGMGWFFSLLAALLCRKQKLFLFSGRCRLYILQAQRKGKENIPLFLKFSAVHAGLASVEFGKAKD